MENNLPSILGGMAQGFTDFGKGLVDMFGTGGASVLDLIESAKTGNVTNRRQDDFRKWLYQTDSTKDAAAKGLGTALNGVQTVADYIPGVNALTQTTLGNAAQGALGGLADELKTYGEDYDLGRAGQRAAISAAGAAVSGGLADALKGSNNALLSSNTVRGLARGATGGAISGGGYAAIDGGDVLEAAKQGAGMGALIGGATGAFQDFKPSKTYNVALTDDERQARIANIDDQLSKLDTSTPEGNARYNELMNARDNYADNRQAQFDLLQKTNPMRDDYHTGIRSPEDIYTLKSIVDSYNADNNFTYPDFTLADAQKALARGNIDVYGSKPIEAGAFISPSKMMATDYAGGGEVYTKNIPLRDFAFIESGDEGNYLPTARALETTLADADMAVNSPRYLTDENGNPRTFYHGSPNKNITEFDVNQAGKNTSSGEHALYFTDSPQVADDFSYERLPGDSMFIENKGAKGRVYPVNLEMNNPLDLDNLTDAQIRELWEYASPLGQLDGQEKFVRNLTDWRDNAHNAQLTKGYLDLDKLRDSQYDGFMARMYPNQDNQAREYAVFDNSKVKMLEDVLANDDMAVNNQTKGLGGSPDGAQNYRTFATGDEAREYFGNSNPGYWDKAPGYDDIQEYTRNGYSRVNDMLRTGQDNYGYPDTDIMIDNIERGIDGYDLKDDIKVYRKSNADVYKNLKVGDTFTDDGFTSASVTPEIGGDFGKANIEIDVGKGKGVGAFIGDLSSGYGDEGEFLLQRGTKYKVVGKDGDKLKLEVVGNERKPLEQILANQDLSVNSAKIAPGQLGLFDQPMPAKQIEEALALDGKYSPKDNKVTETMRARAEEIMGDYKASKKVPENELYNKIDESTLPSKRKSTGAILDDLYSKGVKPDEVSNKVIDQLVEKEIGGKMDKKSLATYLFGDMDDTTRKDFIKKNLYTTKDYDVDDLTEDILKNWARRKATASGTLKKYNIDNLAIVGGNKTVRQGYTGALDSALSERLGIAPGNTYKQNGEFDTPGALGRYIGSESRPDFNNYMVKEVPDIEEALNTAGHERLHSFQAESRLDNRYSKEVADAYNGLASDLKKANAYKSDAEIKNRYKKGTEYWGDTDEQEARMLQQYLGARGFTDYNKRDARMYGELEFDNDKIVPAFDKFFDKLRDLSKRGVALPALAALFGGGAYMASQENDKDKEVK